MNDICTILKGMLSNKTPQQIVMDRIQQENNPMMKNLFQMAQQNDTKSVENFARNFYKERGLDFDKEFGEFMKNFR